MKGFSDRRVKDPLRTYVVTLLAIGGVASVGCSAPAEPQDEPAATSQVPAGTWNIGARTLPAPAGASDELRDAIATALAPDVAASAQAFPATVEGWEAFLAAQGQQRGADMQALADASSVSIERVDIAGVVARYVRPADVRPEHADHLFIHVHGGAFVLGGGDGSVSEAIEIAASVQLPVLSIDYRMPPADPFPAALDDVVAVYEQLLTEREAATMALGGTSAGGALALSATHKFIELDLPLPGAIFAGTPWSDLTQTGDTQFTNEGIDRVLVGYHGLLSGAAQLYAGDHDLRDPLLSPVYGDFQGFPPTYLVTGTRDLFLSDVARTHRKLRAAGVTAELNVYEGMSHAGYLFLQDAPESRQVFAELDIFLRQHLP